MPRLIRMRLISFFVATWFTLVCGVLSWHALSDLRADTASLDWPRVAGQVTRVSHARAPLDDRAWGCPYEVYVTYAYTVGLSSYSSGRVTRSRGFVCADDSDLDSILDRYRIGSKVSVHFQASTPAFAILQPRVQPTDCLGLALFPLSLGFLVFLYLRSRRI